MSKKISTDIYVGYHKGNGKYLIQQEGETNFFVDKKGLYDFFGHGRISSKIVEFYENHPELNKTLDTEVLSQELAITLIPQNRIKRLHSKLKS